MIGSERDGQAVARYLPSNYRVVSTTDTTVTIEGEDRAGWTLDGYVIPRLASGMYRCQETGVRAVCEECGNVGTLDNPLRQTSTGFAHRGHGDTRDPRCDDCAHPPGTHQADSHGNYEAREGIDRCWCGCKYWEHDQCVDCGTTVTDSRVTR